MDKRNAKTGRGAATPKVSTRISTNSSLVALTVTLVLIDILSAKEKPVLTRIFRKASKDGEFILCDMYLAATDGRDLGWALHKAEIFIDDRRIKFSQETIAKLQTPRGRLQLTMEAAESGESEEILASMGFSPENEARKFQMLQGACVRASELLALILHIEKFSKFHDDQNIVNFCYMLIRSLPFINDFKTLRPIIVNHFGRNYVWKLTWELARHFDKVSRRWEEREELSKIEGTPLLRQWKQDRQRSAKARWHYRKDKIAGVKKEARLMRNRLSERLDIPIG